MSMSKIRHEESQRRGMPVLEDERVHKAYSGACEVEYAKALALWNLSVKEGFIAPRPLRMDGRTQTITYERVAFDNSLREAYTRYMKDVHPDEEDIQSIFKAGEILAKIHRGLYLESRRPWAAPQEFLNSMEVMRWDDFPQFCEYFPRAYLHCDYSFANIYFARKNGVRVVVLFDPSPNYHTTFYPDTYGPVYVDIGTLFACLNGRIPLRKYARIRWSRLKEVKDVFLAGYENAAGVTVSRIWSERFGFGVARDYFVKKYRFDLLRGLAIRCLYNRLKGNSPKGFQ